MAHVETLVPREPFQSKKKPLSRQKRQGSPLTNPLRSARASQVPQIGVKEEGSVLWYATDD